MGTFAMPEIMFKWTVNVTLSTIIIIDEQFLKPK